MDPLRKVQSNLKETNLNDVISTLYTNIEQQNEQTSTLNYYLAKFINK